MTSNIRRKAAVVSASFAILGGLLILAGFHALGVVLVLAAGFSAIAGLESA